jgi:hypothetical protein
MKYNEKGLKDCLKIWLECSKAKLDTTIKTFYLLFRQKLDKIDQGILAEGEELVRFTPLCQLVQISQGILKGELSMYHWPPVLQIKTKIVSCHTADSKPVKQEVNSTVILPPPVFLGLALFYTENVFFSKQYHLTRRSTVLSLPLQQRVPWIDLRNT